MIDISAYLEKDLVLTGKEQNIRDEISQRLPAEVIDCHTHYGLRNNVLFRDPAVFGNLISTFPYFDLNLHSVVNRLLYGDAISVCHVAIPFPFYGWDHQANNAYVLSLGQSNPTIIPFLMGDLADLNYTKQAIRSGKWFGLKMYPKQTLVKAKKIIDYFTPELLDLVNELGMCIMLHLPNNLIIDWPELRNLACQYPDIKFMLAHFGLSRDCKHRYEELLSVFAELKRYRHIFLDTAWFFENNILLAALDILGHKRILFATDQPLNLIRCVFLRNSQSGAERVLTSTAYHWVDPTERTQYLKLFQGDIMDVPNIHFRIINSLLTSLDSYSSDGQVLRDVFYLNAYHVLGLKDKVEVKTR